MSSVPVKLYNIYKVKGLARSVVHHYPSSLDRGPGVFSPVNHLLSHNIQYSTHIIYKYVQCCDTSDSTTTRDHVVAVCKGANAIL